MELSTERSALIDLIVAVRANPSDPLSHRRLQKLDDTALIRLAEDTKRQVLKAQAEQGGLPKDYDVLDAKLGRIILDGINHDVRVLRAVRSLLSYFKHDFPRARSRSRARRLNINIATEAPESLAGLLTKHKLPVAPEVISRIKAVRKNNPEAAGALARSIADMEMTSSQKLFIAIALHTAGEVLRPARLLETIDTGRLNQAQATRYNRIMSESEMLIRGPEAVVTEIAENVRTSIAPHLDKQPKQASFRMAYVAASTLPYNKVGYTTRTHRVVRAINAAAKDAGGELVVVARPGFPFDRSDLNSTSLAKKRYSDVDTIRYHYLDAPVPMQDSLISFATEASKQLAGFFLENGVGAVTAASNHVNSLSALIAARVLGLPFTYEVRGLWEETQAAKRHGWEKTERYAVERLMETYVIGQADSAFFITRQVRELFFSHDDPDARQRAYLAPNCAVLDEDRPNVVPYSGDAHHVLELFYVGSLVEYEGLQLLLDALANMPDRDKFHLTIVGGGNYATKLRDQAEALEIGHIVTFEGRVDPSAVPQFFERAHVVMVPRLPYRVCNLVSPLKPLEAMSYGRVCLVSDVAPMKDLITEGETGFLFAAGDQSSLEMALRRVYCHQKDFLAVAEAALDYLSRNRDWRDVGRKIYTVNLESVYAGA